MRKPTKKQTIYILVILIIAIILYFAWKKFKTKIGSKLVLTKTPVNEEEAIKDIAEKYGIEIARNVERIYRLETNHFQSEQYKNTASAGMVKQGINLPYGFTSLSEFWFYNQNYKPVENKFWTWENADNISFTYIGFDNFGGFYSLAEYLKKYDNNAGRWNSINLDQQLNYVEALSNINLQFV